MGEDFGNKEKGQLIDLNTKLRGRGLSEVKEENANKSFRNFCEQTVRDFEATHTPKEIESAKIYQARKYGPTELSTIIMQALRGQDTGNEIYLYAVAKEYLNPSTPESRRKALWEDVDKDAIKATRLKCMSIITHTKQEELKEAKVRVPELLDTLPGVMMSMLYSVHENEIGRLSNTVDYVAMALAFLELNKENQ